MKIEDLAAEINSPSAFTAGISKFLDQKRDEFLNKEKERIMGITSPAGDEEDGT